ncbi:MAG: hypothetical protein ACREMO_11855 [Gemmatimonadales bacterium]
MRIVSILFLCYVLAPPLLGQQAPVPSAVTDQSPFRPLDLPTPNGVRTGSGAPGREYWQQRVDYVISASLDTAAKAVTGQERITYTNNSPDTLRYLWLQLDQNLFTHSSLGFLLFPQGAEFGPPGSDGGFTLTSVAQPALPRAPSRPFQKAASLAYTINGTMMRVDLPRPLPPRIKYVFDLAWSFPFGAIHDRMGVERVDGDYVYQVAQWYPRLAVYDDVRGWNTDQYLGQAEFYLEYGSFDVSLTVPANMLVAATGLLQNPLTVLTSTQRRRLAQARASDQTVMIRSREDRRPRFQAGLGDRHVYLALHRRQRSGLRLGRGPPLHLGCGWGERRPHPGDELLSTSSRLALARSVAVCQERDREVLHPVARVSLPRCEQYQRPRTGRHGVSDDCVLR